MSCPRESPTSAGNGPKQKRQIIVCISLFLGTFPVQGASCSCTHFCRRLVFCFLWEWRVHAVRFVFPSLNDTKVSYLMPLTSKDRFRILNDFRPDLHVVPEGESNFGRKRPETNMAKHSVFPFLSWTFPVQGASCSVTRFGRRPIFCVLWEWRVHAVRFGRI